MKNFKKQFKDKKITVMGLGLLGRGAGDTAFLAECGANLIVTDLKNKKQLANSIKILSKYKNITYRLSEHKLEDFRNRDFILKSAGVPINSPYLLEARKNGIKIEMSASLFAKVSKIPIIGITGTRGKSTVTHLL
ncbi:MAG: UDP-N-acetylmuramoyl-L-alanine--D-glutamate ligase, partial [Candidatus Paceibacterota bacterium]